MKNKLIILFLFLSAGLFAQNPTYIGKWVQTDTIQINKKIRLIEQTAPRTGNGSFYYYNDSLWFRTLTGAKNLMDKSNLALLDSIAEHLTRIENIEDTNNIQTDTLHQLRQDVNNLDININTDTLLVNNNLSISTDPIERLRIDGDLGYYPKHQKAFVTFSFDDGHVSDDSLMRPLFTSKGVVASSAITTNWVGTMYGGYVRLEWREIDSLANSGWEIMSHTLTHTPLRSISIDSINDELKNSKDTLIAHGFKVTNLSYPYHDQDNRVREVAQRYYRSARGANEYLGGGQDYTFSLNPYVLNTYRLNCYAADDPLLLATYKVYVDSAISQKKWLIFYLHQTTAADVDSLGKLIDYILAAGVDIVTPQQALDSIGNYVEYGDNVAINERGLRVNYIYPGRDTADNSLNDVRVYGQLYPDTLKMPSLTAKSVLFSDGSMVTQDNTNFNFTNANDSLYALKIAARCYKGDSMKLGRDTVSLTTKMQVRLGDISISRLATQSSFLAFYENSTLKGVLQYVGSQASTTTRRSNLEIAGATADTIDVVIRTQTAGTGYNRLIAKHTTGNIGINTDNPSEKFEVNGDIKLSNLTDTIKIGTQTITNTKVTAWDLKEPAISAGTTSQYWRGDKSWQTLGTMAFRDSSSGLRNLGTNHYINTNVRIGGSTAPTVALDVTGDVLSSGSITSKKSVTTVMSYGFYANIGANASGSATQRESPAFASRGMAWNGSVTKANEGYYNVYVYPTTTGAATSYAHRWANTTVDGTANTTNLMFLHSSGMLSVGAGVDTSKGTTRGMLNAYSNSSNTTLGGSRTVTLNNLNTTQYNMTSLAFLDKNNSATGGYISQVWTDHSGSSEDGYMIVGQPLAGSVIERLRINHNGIITQKTDIDTLMIADSVLIGATQGHTIATKQYVDNLVFEQTGGSYQISYMECIGGMDAGLIVTDGCFRNMMLSSVYPDQINDTLIFSLKNPYTINGETVIIDRIEVTYNGTAGDSLVGCVYSADYNEIKTKLSTNPNLTTSGSTFIYNDDITIEGNKTYFLLIYFRLEAANTDNRISGIEVWYKF